MVGLLSTDKKRFFFIRSDISQLETHGSSSTLVMSDRFNQSLH